jgi:hypothetical protein
MSDPRSRPGVLVGLAAAVSALGAAAMMSAASAPTAHADDFTDIITAVDADFTAGQSDFATAFADFDSNAFAPGLTIFFEGLDADILTAPNNIALGTAEALQDETLSFTLPDALTTPTSFAEALTVAQADVIQGEADLASIAVFLGDGTNTALVELLEGTDSVSVLPLEELLLGAAVSF